MRQRRSNSRGFMVADAIVALIVITILAGVLAVSMHQQNRAAQRLADQRANVRLAEQTLVALQTGQTPPSAPEGVSVVVSKLAGHGDLPAGTSWAMVTVTQAKHATELAGVVRTDVVPNATPDAAKGESR